MTYNKPNINHDEIQVKRGFHLNLLPSSVEKLPFMKIITTNLQEKLQQSNTYMEMVKQDDEHHITSPYTSSSNGSSTKFIDGISLSIQP
jgi:hypothetical protein